VSEFAGRGAVITGGGRGIGLACARLIAERGGSVVLLGHDRAMVDEAAAGLRDDGLKASAVVADISVEAEVEAAIATSGKMLGSIDILVNNAAIQPYGTVASMNSGEWDKVIGINLRGTYLCCKHALKVMLAQGRGHILNVLSIASQTALPGSAAYTASKFGALGLTKVLAAEVRAQGIKVTAVIPGAVNTPLWDKSGGDLDRRKMLSPTDVAAAMLSVIAQPPSIYTDEIVLMPPLGIL